MIIYEVISRVPQVLFSSVVSELLEKSVPVLSWADRQFAKVRSRHFNIIQDDLTNEAHIVISSPLGDDCTARGSGSRVRERSDFLCAMHVSTLFSRLGLTTVE